MTFFHTFAGTPVNPPNNVEFGSFDVDLSVPPCACYYFAPSADYAGNRLASISSGTPAPPIFVTGSYAQSDLSSDLSGRNGGTVLKSVLVSWSGGKDSCLALHEVLKGEDYTVAALLTTITRDYDRISMHGVRRILLEWQAKSLGLPLEEVFITRDATNQEYETEMGVAFSRYREKGIDSVVFGDLFLEEIRAYRDQFLGRHNMSGIYPVWMRSTRELIRDFIDLGFKAVITCVNSEVLDPGFAGMMIDEDFIGKLPPDVDPCGENGEFHSFVFDGPLFKEPVRFSVGEKVARGSFWFCDLLPE